MTNDHLCLSYDVASGSILTSYITCSKEICHDIYSILHPINALVKELYAGHCGSVGRALQWGLKGCYFDIGNAS